MKPETLAKRSQRFATERADASQSLRKRLAAKAAVEGPDSIWAEMLAELEKKDRQQNPSLLVLGNPRGRNPTLTVEFGKILGYVERLEYERTASPRGFYFHDFGNDDALWTATLADGQRVVVLANVNHKPLWGNR